MTRGNRWTGPISPIDRLMARIVHTPGLLATDCWVPTYSPRTTGYCAISGSDGKTLLCHRVAFEHFVGPIPDGLQIDHLCRRRACCNPEHLEPVTSSENSRRGNNRYWVAHRNQTCVKGHALEGRRRCHECELEQARQSRRRRGQKPWVSYGTRRCTVEQCDRVYHARGLCRHHYNQAHAANTIDGLPRIRATVGNVTAPRSDEATA